MKRLRICLDLWDDIKWNEVVNNEILLFEFKNNEWSGMKFDGMYTIEMRIFLIKYQTIV